MVFVLSYLIHEKYSNNVMLLVKYGGMEINMRKYNIFQKLLSVLSVVVLSANFIGINVEAAETNNVENVEYHVVGTLFDEEYTLDENMLIYNDPNLPKEENGLARKPGTGVYLFTIEDFWTGRMTMVY